jgi:hypothetical protein
MSKLPAKVVLSIAALAAGVVVAQMAAGRPPGLAHPWSSAKDRRADCSNPRRWKCRAMDPDTTSADSTAPGTASPAFAVTSSLADGQTVTGAVVWEAHPSGAPVGRVEFLIDGAARHTEYSAPYRFGGDSGTWDTTSVSNGVHTLTVGVLASDGRRAHTSLRVTVSNAVPSPPPAATSPPPAAPSAPPAAPSAPPAAPSAPPAAPPAPPAKTPEPALTVTTNVTNGQTLSGTVPWEASPSGAPVSKVEFLVDGAVAHTQSSAPFRFGDGWDTTRVANGDHELGVRATASDGRSARADIRVRIENTVSRPPEPSSGTYFGTLPPGASLPSGEECAARVRRSSWEPRPENTAANNTTPAGGVRLSYISGVNYDGDRSNIPSARARELIARVDGAFKGTTDEIIQWGACKWGFDEELLRAVAVNESTWRQSENGDNGQSFGLLQIKVTIHEGTWPWAKESTAFNVDYALAWRRLMFEGHMSNWVPAEAVGNELACISMWFAGDWNWTAGRQGYLDAAARHLAEKPWLSW